MRRTQVYLTDEQARAIHARAEDAGVPKAEVIRGLLDRGLGLDPGAGERRRAIESTAGMLEGEDDWPQWLTRVRGGRGAAERLESLER